MNIKRMYAVLGLFTLSAFAFTGCGESADPRVEFLTAKKWVYEYIQVGTNRINGNEIPSPVMEFSKDKTYMIHYQQRGEGGKWEMRGDTLVTTPDGGDESAVQKRLLVSASADTVVLEAQADETMTVKMVLVPAPAGSGENAAAEKDAE